MFLFENIFGIMFGLIILCSTMLITGLFKDRSKNEIIINISLFTIWYIVTVILNKLFPYLLTQHKLAYALISIVILKILSVFLENHLY